MLRTDRRNIEEAALDTETEATPDSYNPKSGRFKARALDANNPKKLRSKEYHLAQEARREEIAQRKMSSKSEDALRVPVRRKPQKSAHSAHGTWKIPLRQISSSQLIRNALAEEAALLQYPYETSDDEFSSVSELEKVWVKKENLLRSIADLQDEIDMHLEAHDDFFSPEGAYESYLYYEPQQLISQEESEAHIIDLIDEANTLHSMYAAFEGETSLEDEDEQEEADTLPSTNEAFRAASQYRYDTLFPKLPDKKDKPSFTESDQTTHTVTRVFT